MSAAKRVSMRESRRLSTLISRGDTVLVARLMSSSPTADPREPVWTTVTVSPSRLAMRHCGDAGSEGSMAVWEWPPMMMSISLLPLAMSVSDTPCVTSYPRWLTAITISAPSLRSCAATSLAFSRASRYFTPVQFSSAMMPVGLRLRPINPILWPDTSFITVGTKRSSSAVPERS